MIFKKIKKPEIVLLTPGIYNSAYYEHSYLAQQMGIDLVEGRDLIVKKGFVYKKTIEGLEKIDVIYRRVDDEFLDPEVGNPDSVIGVKGLIKCYIKKQNVSIVNAPGCGIADDKAVYNYVPEMINFFLKEDPVLPNIKTYLMSNNKKERDYVFENIRKMVIKPVAEAGGYGLKFIHRRLFVIMDKNLKTLTNKTKDGFNVLEEKVLSPRSILQKIMLLYETLVESSLINCFIDSRNI